MLQHILNDVYGVLLMVWSLILVLAPHALAGVVGVTCGLIGVRVFVKNSGPPKPTVEEFLHSGNYASLNVVPDYQDEIYSRPNLYTCAPSPLKAVNHYDAETCPDCRRPRYDEKF